MKLTVVRSKFNPEQTYEEFKAARLQGFGASDIGPLLNEGDYSCKRRLFLERLGLLEDDDLGLRFHVERGRFFEGPVADLIAKKTGHELRQVGPCYIKEFPFMRANPDRLVVVYKDATKGPEVGVLEIKCPSVHSFRKITKEGLPQAYILQLQWQMFCAGTKWGIFAVFCAELFELEWFEIQRDEELIQGLFTKAKEEWAFLQSMAGDLATVLSQGQTKEHFLSYYPPLGTIKPLDSHSKACAKCPAFEKCHGITFAETGSVIDRPDLERVAAQYVQNKDAMKSWEKAADDAKEILRAAFAETPCDYIRAGQYKIKVSQRSRESISSKVKEVLTKKELVQYVKQTTYEVVDVKEQK